jgi:hypothetical protein
VVKRDKRGLVLGCSRVRETGLCDNRRTVALREAEARVWEGIERLAAPEVIAAHVEELYRYWHEMKESEGRRRRALERELATVERELRKAVDAVLAQEDVRAERARPYRDRVNELEAKREDLERAIADVAAPAFELHPNVAEQFRHQVAELKKAFAWINPEGRGALQKTFEALDPEGRAEAARELPPAYHKGDYPAERARTSRSTTTSRATLLVSFGCPVSRRSLPTTSRWERWLRGHATSTGMGYRRWWSLVRFRQGSPYSNKVLAQR